MLPIDQILIQKPTQLILGLLAFLEYLSCVACTGTHKHHLLCVRHRLPLLLLLRTRKVFGFMLGPMCYVHTVHLLAGRFPKSGIFFFFSHRHTPP